VEQVKTIKSLKAELKLEAKELRNTKTETKTLQRKNEYAGSLQYSIRGLKRSYRHRHIAYCMLRGKKYEEIELTCRSDNEPDFSYIEEIYDAYSE